MYRDMTRSLVLKLFLDDCLDAFDSFVSRPAGHGEYIMYILYIIKYIHYTIIILLYKMVVFGWNIAKHEQTNTQTASVPVYVSEYRSKQDQMYIIYSSIHRHIQNHYRSQTIKTILHRSQNILLILHISQSTSSTWIGLAPRFLWKRSMHQLAAPIRVPASTIDHASATRRAPEIFPEDK